LSNSNCAPPLAVTVPWRIVPPRSFHDPVLASRARPPLIVPVILTVPPLRLKPVLAEGLGKTPPRFNVAVSQLIVPGFLQIETSSNVAPLVASSVPRLSRPTVPPRLIVRVCPGTSA